MKFISLAICLVISVIAIHSAEGNHYNRNRFSWLGRWQRGNRGEESDGRWSKGLRDLARKIKQFFDRRQNRPRNSHKPALPALASNLGLNTLVNLVTQAGLAGALSGPGPLTVFGPSDAAFQTDIDPSAPLSPAELTAVLKYHVLGQKATSAALKDELLLPTLEGSNIRVNVYPNGVVTAQCKPINLNRVDNFASNGVLHILEGVMQPPTGDIVQTAAGTPSLGTLVQAVQVAGLVGPLSGPGPLTVFAPTDAAFNKVPQDILNRLLSDVTLLQEVLKYHVVQGTACAAGLTNSRVTTLNGNYVEISVGNGVVVNNANVIAADVSVTNGVVHVIDQVLIPPGLLARL